MITTKIEAQLREPSKICEIHNPEKGKEKVLKEKGTCACIYIEKHMPISEIEVLYDKKEIMTNNLGRYEAQMKQMDLDVYGSKKTNQYPDGVDGIEQQLEALRELEKMCKQYMKSI